MKTNTEINTWEIKDNPVYEKGLYSARPKMWDKTDHIVTISNVTISEKELEDLTSPYMATALAKIKIGNQEAIVNGADLIVAVENALHSFREECNHHGRTRNPY